MSEPYHIQYLTRGQIDKAKWDQCIERAANGLIYAYSYYLDHMSLHWDALVLNDYEMVMPLTWNKKYAIPYLYQPFLTSQLGVFGNNIQEQQVEDFILAIPKKFRYIDISLNSQNNIIDPIQPFTERSNYLLSLNFPYERLFQNYRENSRRNIKKAIQQGCTVQKDFGVEKVIGLASQQMESRENEKISNLEHFRKLYQYLHQRQQAITYGVFSGQQELLASSVFFFSHNRAYYILVGNNPEGKSTGASHALIDGFIKDHAGMNILLDFEGSDIHSLAFFYSSFGAAHETYPAIKMNRLPFFLKWLKK